MAHPRVLCLTDEPHLLDALRDRFAVETADDGADALERLRRDPDGYSMVVANAPATPLSVFLREARRVAPAAARIVLAGWADTDAADHAVRSGLALRALSTPCSARDLLSACAAA
jgi:ActR/RegA family two-component response regulator